MRNVNHLDPWVQLLIGLIFLGLAIFCFSKDKVFNLAVFFMSGFLATEILPFSISEILKSIGYKDNSVVDFNFNILLVLLFFSIITLLRLVFTTRKNLEFV